MVDGWFFVLFGLLIALATAVPARGRVGRNPLLGIRLEPLTRSPWHWREGHRAAGQVIYPTAAVLVGLGWGVLRGVGAVMHGPPADDAAHPPRGGSGRIDG